MEVKRERGIERKREWERENGTSLISPSVANLLIRVIRVRKSGKRFPWDHQEVGRGLRVDVIKCHTLQWSHTAQATLILRKWSHVTRS